MDQQNEKAPKNEEIMELTLDQTDRVSGGRGNYDNFMENYAEEYFDDEGGYSSHLISD